MFLRLPSNNAELLNQNLPPENNNLSEADFFNQVGRSLHYLSSTLKMAKPLFEA
jgi:hypothetical protein